MLIQDLAYLKRKSEYINISNNGTWKLEWKELWRTSHWDG